MVPPGVVHALPPTLKLRRTSCALRRGSSVASRPPQAPFKPNTPSSGRDDDVFGRHLKSYFIREAIFALTAAVLKPNFSQSSSPGAEAP